MCIITVIIIIISISVESFQASGQTWQHAVLHGIYVMCWKPEPSLFVMYKLWSNWRCRRLL